MENQSIASVPDQKQLLTVLNIFIGSLFVLCLVFIALLAAGFGTVQIANLPQNSSVSINGHHITSTTIRLRPGSYQIVIASPTISPFQDTLNVGLFQTVHYSPSTQARAPNAIASSTIGAINGTTIAPELSQVQWFEDSTWLVGYLANGNAALALHYDTTKEQWAVGYYKTAGYPSNQASLPSDVSSYIQQLEAQHAK